MPSTANTVSFRETTYHTSDRVTVDDAGGKIRGVKILGRKSPSRNREYSESALRNAVAQGIYEGAKVNLNHMPSKGSEFRSILDRIGLVSNTHYVEGDGGGIFGDVDFNPEHPYAKALAWFAKHSPKSVGLSHDAIGKESVKLPGGTRVVEEIHKVNSVDLVADPATNRGLFESETGAPEMELSTLTAAQLKEARPDLVTALVSESDQAKSQADEVKRLKEAAAASDQKLAEATGKLNKLEAEKALAERKVARVKLAEGILKAEQLTDLFTSQLVEAKDDDTAKALIEDRRKLLEGATSQAPKSKGPGQGGDAGAMPKDAKEFAAALK